MSQEDASGVVPTPDSSIIDQLLPDWDVGGEHRIEIDASPAIVYEAVRTLDLGRSWGVRQLFRLRGLPQAALTIDGLQSIRFAMLADVPPREMVMGLIGRFWTFSGSLRRTDAAHFKAFSESGYAKAAWNFRVHEESNGRVVLTTETRVLCLDEASRRSFRRYWHVIRPFSGWIRRQALQVVKAESERVKR